MMRPAAYRHGLNGLTPGAFAALATFALLACAAPARAADGAPSMTPSPEQQKFFESTVRPLLAENCFACHGEKKHKGGLRLDSLEAALKGGDDHGPAVVPGKPEKSPIILAVSYKDDDFQMPPEEGDRLSPEQVATLTAWVQMGAPWPAGKGPGAATFKSKKRTITDADRAFWSFQPAKDSPVPAVDDAGWCRNPVDRFVIAKLKAEGLAPAPEADRVTLIRRATFDLHGLPPTPGEVEAFVNDPSRDAYERLVDRLLASPRYGERYARHWLDLVRYAESDGFKQDAYRPDAWPYRDYVIKSLNDDKPYDRFVREQLAGDELAPDDPNVLVGVSYLRNGIYEYNQRDVPKQRAEVLNDLTDVTADAFLGLSMGCARCHDHKFDPILQSDYFRLQAFLSPVIARDDMVLATAKEKAEYQATLAKWEAKTAALRKEIDAIERQPLKNAETRVVVKFPPDVQAVWNTPVDQRTAFDWQIIYYIRRQIEEETRTIGDKIKGADKDRLTDLRKKLAESGDRPKPLPPAFVATDAGPVAPATVIPGDPQKRDQLPGYPVVLDGLSLETPAIVPTATSTGRRTALANWLTEPKNPLTTRVIANRLWQWHFGQGLVRTPSDYGTLGERPTHPELLDWLTTRFVEGGWSMKKAHRLLMTSATYRQASVAPVPALAKAKDPEGRLLWRFGGRRLEAEQIRDAMLAVSGELWPSLASMGGPASDISSARRSVYTRCARNTHDPLLESFDAPESFGSVANRNNTTTATQALLMINGDWPLKRAAAFAARLRQEVKGNDPAALVDAAYRIAYARPPRPDERAAAIEFLTRAAAAGRSTGGDRPVTEALPHRGSQAVLIRDANPAEALRLAAPASAPTEDFTIEAFVSLESLYENADVRVIASRWDGDQTHAGWSFGVTSEKSKYAPRNLILQLVCKTDKGVQYEVIASDLRPELHKTYYLAATVKLKDTSEAGVTFYLKDLSDMDAPLRSVGVKHTLTGPHACTSPLILGGRDAAPGKPPHGWDGLIDEVRLSRAALAKEQLLYNDGQAKESVVGHWMFEEEPGFFKDSAGVQKDLTRLPRPAGSAAAGATDSALVDFCHVLLNSNEFLYVD